MNKVIDFVVDKGGVKHAQAVMLQYRDRALKALTQLPASDARESLERLVIYAIERKK